MILFLNHSSHLGYPDIHLVSSHQRRTLLCLLWLPESCSVDIMDDEAVAQFVSFTSSTPDRAAQYLRLTDGDVQQAIDLFFVNDGNDPSGSSSSTHPQPAPTPSRVRTGESGSRPVYEDDRGVVHIDSDPDYSDDDKPEIMGSSSKHVAGPDGPRSAIHTPSSMTPPTGQASAAVDNDEAIARRLQEEFYAGAGIGAEVDPEGIRAPIGRTTETLVGPGSYDANEEDMRAAVMEQMHARHQRRPRGAYSIRTWRLIQSC